jgi:N-acetyl-gamma-glutamyl-phosphate reductase
MNRRLTRVAVIGASGFAGAELLSLLDRDERFSVVAAVADRWAGEPLGRRLLLRGDLARLVVRPMAEAVEAAREAEVALLATPAEASLKLAPALLGRGVRVVDLSGAFRLRDAADYPRWYGFEHHEPALLAEARFGLPEVPAAAHAAGEGVPVEQARLIANPGCYATAAIVGLAPLLARGLIDTVVFSDGKSGVSGAGRKVEERLLFTEIDGNVSPYRVGNHQHVPEIEQSLSRVAGRPVSVTFTPHLMPLTRGLMVTSYARLAEGVDASQIAPAVEEAYGPGADGALARGWVVRARAPGEVTIGASAGTSLAFVGAHGDATRRTAVVVSSLDNLRKGAASQALQNLCAMVGESFEP